MSKTVDEKVVEMRFDNQQFERNVQTSMTTINNLKKSLNMEGAAKGFENIGNAAKNCNVSALGGAVEAVRVKFSALEVMAVTALANITNSAVNAGKRITSALTLDPIRTGFQEYETQINAVQTILANTSSKGTTLDQVNNALDELNHYADMTIYNFTEMTRNIGTFTAAGIDLDTSVSAIKGIANLAAVSGSNSTQASTAMYQLSQALAAGTVKLQDWNSVVNAGMGGQVFQDALKDTARVHGIAIDQMIKDEGSFRETLQKGWLTSEVLTETLAKFTGDLNADQLRTMGYTEQQIQSIIKMGQTANDAATKVKTFTQLFDTLKEAAQSGWTQSWEIIIGDFEEAKELLTSVSDTFSEMINASAESRNKMLQDWKDLGGRTMLIESVRNVFEGLLSVIRPIKEAFRDIFPAMTGQRLAEITEKIRDLTAKFKIGEETSKNLKNTFKGLFAVFDIVAQAVKAIFKASGSLFDVFSNLGGGVLKLTGHFGNWLVKLDQVIKQSNIFNHVLQGIVSVIEFVVKSIADLLHLLNEKVVFPGFQAFHSFLGKIHEKMSDVVGGANDMETGVVDAVEGMNQAVSENKILQFFQSLWEGIKTVTSKIIGAFGKIWSVIHEKFQNIDFGAVTNAITSLSIGSVALAIDKLLGKIGKTFDGLKGVLKSTTKILDGVRGCLEAYQTRLKAGTLLRIATSIAILSASIVAISLIDTDRLFISLGAITTLFGDLIGAMAVFNKISKYSKGVIRSSVLMLSMSSSISILASALKKIGDLDWKQLSTGMGGIVALTAIMVASAKVLGKDEKTVIKGVWEIHAFVIAIQLLAGIVKDLGALDWESLAKGLVGVAGLSATIAATAKIMSNGQKAIIKGATKMIIFAAAIKVLASACKDLSKLSWTELAKGLTGVGVLLAEVSIFMNNAKLSRKSIATATGIVILSSAIKILASACKDFGQLSVKEIIKGLSSIGVLLAEISVFTKLSGDAKHVISTGISLIAISSAMKILASAVGDFGSLSLKEIGKGLTTMAVALAEVVAAMRLMPKSVMLTGTGLIAVGIALETISIAVGSFGKLSVKELSKGLVALGVALAELSVGLNLMKGTLSGSAAMLVAASAIAILTPSLFVLSAISWQGIAKSLILLAGAFTVIGTAGLLLQPLVPTLIGLSGAFALIGVGAVAIGAGMLAAGVGLTSLATGLEALAGVQTARVKAFVDSLKIIITGVAEMIPVIIGKIGEGFVEFCKAIEAGAPDIMSTVKTLILGLIDIMVECVPNLVDGVFKMVTEILKSLVEYTPQIVDSIFHFLIGILEGIAKNLPTLIKAAADVLMAFLTGIFDAFAGMDTDVLLKGLAGIGILSGIMVALGAVATLVPGAMVGVLGMGAVVAELAAVLAAIGGLQQIPGLSWLIGEGGKLLGSIGNAIGSFVGGIVGGVMEGISSSFPQIGANLSAFMINIQPFIEGASQIDASSLDGVKALAEIILMLTAADILDGLTAWFTGGSSLTQFAEELVPFGTAMKQFAVEIAGLDGKLVSEAAIAGRTLAEMAATLPNSGGVLGFFAGENDLDTFSEKVVPFGRAMKAFAAEVAGLDPAVVTNAATAGKALAEMAATLPNSGGVVGFFAGENDLDTFGEKLAPFGRALKEFALEVEGLDPNAVVNAATAGQAMAEMAKTLPNSGGVVGFFAGENDLDTFGEKLVPFGKALKEFAIEVRGLVVEDVEKAATAGQMMAELEKNIDNTGGVVGFFVGNNDLDTFGEKLPPFGRALKEFALAVQGLVVEDVEHAANAGRMLAELEQALPKDGGIVSWFAGNKDLAGFGDKLRMFGQGLADFYTCIIIINPDALARVIAEINKLVDLAKGMETLDTGKMSGFSKALTDLGKSGVEGFISAFTDATSRVKDAAANVLTTFINSAKSKQTDLTNTFTSLVDAVLTILKNKYNDFTNAGKEYMVKFIAGVKSQVSDCQTTFTKLISDILTSIRNRNQEFTTVGQECMTKLIAGIRGQENNAKQVFTNLVTACLTAVKNKYPEFESSGKECIIKLITGVKSKEEELKQSFVLIISAALNSIRNSYDEFYSAGNYLVEGFAEGINKNTYKAEAKARAMAKAAAKAAKKELDEHSPSKVFYQIGAFAAQGLVNALSDYEPIAGDAGTSVAHSAMEGLRKTIAKMCDLAISDIDIQPTIRPVLDLSDVRSESKKLNAMFSREQAMSISRSMNRREMESTIQNEGNTSPQNGNIYQFTQNNYSPKPLSRLEIYRQTRNQFSAMREAVERV